MDIPKFIDNSLRLRCKYALLLWDNCSIVDKFISSNNISLDNEDYMTGVEIYVNPIASEARVREAILRHNK